MHAVFLSLVVGTALASPGLAVWVLRATVGMRRELRNFSGFEGIHFEE